MSIERALEILTQKHDHDKDYPGLFEELAALETETLDQGEPEPYHQPLSIFLGRMEELLDEEDFDKDIAVHAAFNLRVELERIRDNHSPSDPLEHVFQDMAKFESGTAASSQVLITLSRYEVLVLALRHQFESSTDPTDERAIPMLMRQGLQQLESASNWLRQQLNSDTDTSFEAIRREFLQGAERLREFRRRAAFEIETKNEDFDQNLEEDE